MYMALDVPVVPVALDSGLYWGRNSLILWPGTARAKFLPPILPGLSAEAFKETLIERIEGATNRLILEAVERGLEPPDLGRDARQAAGARRSRTHYILTVHRL